MARTSRSSAQPSVASDTKKRKRESDASSPPPPPPPHKRSPSTEHHPHPSLAGNNPLLEQHASQILQILEKLDNQGLLDRTFPLQGDEEEHKSLRTLLEEHQHHSLSVIRTAVTHLLPISSHPRSRPSAPAAQQTRFCQLAFSLLDQASRYNAPAPEFAPPLKHEDQQQQEALLTHSRKYALVQHLPTGEYWSSLNSIADTNIKDLPTGHASLVSVVQDAPTATSPSYVSQPVPTLGSYSSKPPTVLPTIKPRFIKRGSYLDYGSFTSFAPTFDQDGAEIGMEEVGGFYWWRDQVRKEREKWRRTSEPGTSAIPAQNQESPVNGEDVEMSDARPLPNGDATVTEEEEKDLTEPFKDLLSSEELATLKVGLSTLELEKQVQELLEHNARALGRLEELQVKRISEGGIPLEGTEEWDTANAILSSLSILTSLRPRSSSSYTSDPSPIVPSTTLLRKLHRTLPLSNINTTNLGWRGTLPPNKSFALRDDSTVKIMGKVPATATVPPPTTPYQPNGARAVGGTAAAAAIVNPSYFTTPLAGQASPAPSYSLQQPQTPQPAQYTMPSTPAQSTGAYTATSTSGWYNTTVPYTPSPAPQQQTNGYHQTPVVANTVQRGGGVAPGQYAIPSLNGGAATSSAPPLPSHLRSSFR